LQRSYQALDGVLKWLLWIFGHIGDLFKTLDRFQRRYIVGFQYTANWAAKFVPSEKSVFYKKKEYSK